MVRIVGGADHDSGGSPEGARQIGNGRCRHRPQQPDVDTGRGQAGLQRRLEHVAGKTGVLADQHTVALTVPLERLAGGPPQLQHELRRNGKISHLPADSVRSKVFPLGHQPASFTAVATLTASTVSLTSCTRTMLAPFMAAIVAAARLAGKRSPTSRPVSCPSMDLRDTPISSG